MIEFAKILGEIEGNNLRVRMRTGETLYAPMVVVGTDMALPSRKWINSNKDNFLALVTYEKDLLMSPMIVGFYPVKGADSSSYNTSERLLAVIIKLLDQLTKAKVNTFIGPQPFMPDTIKELISINQELSEIQELITSLKL